MLARTTTLLREVALACAGRGIGFAGADEAGRHDGRPRDAGGVPAAAGRPAGGAAGRRRAGAAGAQPFAAAGRGGRGGGRACAPGPTSRRRWPAWARNRGDARGSPRPARCSTRLAGEPTADRLIARLRGDGRARSALRGAGTPERDRTRRRGGARTGARPRPGARRSRQFAASARRPDRGAARAPRDDAVELTTIHGAKGREWDRVILYGADEGQLPHAHSMADDDGGVEDERRLCYVALTRARHAPRHRHARWVVRADSCRRRGSSVPTPG